MVRYCLGVRDITIVVNCEDDFQHSDVTFVTPKESPRSSGITMNMHCWLLNNWETMEKEIIGNIELYQQIGIEGMQNH